MQEFDVFYYHSPITYTLTKLIIDQEKKAFYCEIGGRGIHHPGTMGFGTLKKLSSSLR